MEENEVFWGFREVSVFTDGRVVTVPMERLYSSGPIDFDLFEPGDGSQLQSYFQTLKQKGYEIAPGLMEAADGRPLNDKIRERVVDMIRASAAQDNLIVEIAVEHKLP